MSLSVLRERSEGYLFSWMRYGSVGALAGVAESDTSWTLRELSFEERESGNVIVDIFFGSLTFSGLYFSSTSVRPDVNTVDKRLLWKLFPLRRDMLLPLY